jgi:hypothetical protein
MIIKTRPSVGFFVGQFVDFSDMEKLATEMASF